MGILGAAKSAGKKIVNKLATENMRKYVWYDYSIVEKAKIQLVRSDGVTIGSVIPGHANELKADGDPLPVQINPADFTSSYHIGVETVTNRLLQSGEEMAKGFVRQTFGDVDRNPCEIPLIYDIYDEYNARSMNGTMTNDFSLMNDKATSLPKLVEHAKAGDRYALFVWGDIKKFGLLTGINVTYNAFSPWGQALKASATLYLAEQNVDAYNLAIDGYEDSTVSTGKKVLNGIKNVFR